MNKLIKLARKFILSLSLLYLYNIIMQPYNIPIPINIFTVLITMIFSISGFLGLILLFFINFR